MSDNKSIENSKWLTLGDDDTIKMWSHPSIYHYLPMIILSIILVLIGIILPFFVSGYLIYIAIALIPLGLGLLAYEYLLLMSIFYVATNKSIIKKTGIIRTNLTSISYEDIDKSRKQVSIPGRFLKYGTIKIETAASTDDTERDGTDLKLEHVPRSYEMYDIIENQT